MRHLGAFGEWFERTYWQCCKAHDLAYIQNTNQRQQGRPHLKSRSDIDAAFYDCLINSTLLPVPLIPEIAWVSVRLFYWPSRMVKWLLGKSKVV